MKANKLSKSEKTKENIINETIKLINESNGNVEAITIRKIAERVNSSVGLINHYFESKDLLIEECVQRFIREVVQSFHMPIIKKESPTQLAACAMKQVVDFLMQQEQVSQISILGDLKNPGVRTNTMGTVNGIAYYLGSGEITQLHKRQAYTIVAVVQEAFLCRKVLKEMIGIDFYDKIQRDEYIDQVVRGVTKQIIEEK